MAAFSAKVALFRAKRALIGLGSRARRFEQSREFAGVLLAEISTPLRPRGGVSDSAEARLIDGKIENLRVALRRLDGTLVPAGATFSFWKQIGRATRAAGYVEGRELREGCIVPSIGGGLCALSNALYGAALDAGCEIVERHRHSAVVPGSLAERGRDATVFWNYVDLRFRARSDLHIRALLESDRLLVRMYALRVAQSAALAAASEPFDASQSAAKSCASCAVASCGRHRAPIAAQPRRSAFLLDAYWPEHDAFVAASARSRDVVCMPIDGKRFGFAQYAWSTTTFGSVHQAPLATIRRSLQSRRLAAHGAERQRAMLLHAAALAARFADELAPDIDHLVVSQALLPFLWASGHLGGRTFDVLATSLPMRALHAALDAALRRHPESPTLGDFRAAPAIVDDESAAFARARLIVTPHSEIARHFGERAHLVPWAAPRERFEASSESGVFFAGSTLGRAGSYEMRAAAQRLSLRLLVAGGDELEVPGFWDGVRVRFVDDFARGLTSARTVVLPAVVEHRPRRLLVALASGAQVIATPACGLPEQPGLTLVPAGDVDALCAALEGTFAGKGRNV